MVQIIASWVFVISVLLITIYQALKFINKIDLKLKEIRKAKHEQVVYKCDEVIKKAKMCTSITDLDHLRDQAYSLFLPSDYRRNESLKEISKMKLFLKLKSTEFVDNSKITNP